MKDAEDKATADTSGFRLILLYQVVLRPMGLVYLISGAVYGLRGEWMIGALFLLIVFGLLRLWKWLQWMLITEAHIGPLPADEEEEFPEEISPMSHEEADILSKSMTVIGFFLGLTTIVLMIHYGVKTYVAIPAGIIAAWAGSHIVGIAFITFSVWLEPKLMNLNHEGK